ncbi:MAG: YggS family pyridoxal phosphate-dependent enzyme [Moraxella sp.]|nr:YggS family pyridoxal phosphate-dependent enzyme [Moraxella sp.]
MTKNCFSDALTERYHAINDTLPPSVSLLCVSKTKPADDIRTLAKVGQVHFGENYLQECLVKQKELSDLPLVWHYIGHIQRNKTKDIATQFDWVQTVERAIIAERLNEQRGDLPPLNVLIQVNIDDEMSKSGCAVSELDELVKLILTLPKLSLRGLMIIPNKEGTDAFIRTKVLFDDIKEKFNPPHWDTLSMGMSGDKEQAIKNGSTMIRVGSAIFGERTKA